MSFKIDDCPLIGRWRIVGSDSWDRDHLDLSGPAFMVVRNDNGGVIEFGALHASLDLSYSKTMIFSDWEGSDEGDEVLGDGHAALNEDGSAEITLTFRRGDEAVLSAVRDDGARA